MNELTPHIQYLVTQHDCVVIPGFGALIAHRREARLMADGMIAPPERTLGFNPALCHNDGLLASSVARRKQISYQAAVSEVSAAIERLRKVYDVAGRVDIARIGTFTRQNSGSMLFTPDASRPVANAAFKTLMPVRAVQQAAPQPESAPASLRVSPWRRVASAVASVAVLLALGAVLSTPVNIDRTDAAFASLATPAITPAPEPEFVAEPLPLPADPSLYIMVPAAEPAAAVAPAAEPAAAVAPAARMNDADRYYLVVSSHATAAQARKYMAARPSERLAVLEADGRFRVYAATGATYAAARSLMNQPEFAGLHPDGWVYRRR